MDDEKIINLYIERKEEAIKETDIKYGKYCKVIANNIVCNNSDAEECVNDTYLKTWNTIPPTVPTIFKAYIGRITRNLALVLYRNHNRLKRGGGEVDLVIDELEECIAGSNQIENELENARITEVINEFLISIPKENRIIFVRRYWYTESLSDIASKLSISESKVKSMLYRMRQKLKDKFVAEEIEL